MKGQTNFCLSFPPTRAEQPHKGDRCLLIRHPYPVMDAFEPDQARDSTVSLSSPM